MSDLFTRILRRTTVAHVVCIVGIFVLPSLSRFFVKEKPVEEIQFVDLFTPAPSLPAPAPEETKVEPKPKPEPEPAPPKPTETIPDVVKTPAIKKTNDVPKIKISTNRITKAKTTPATAKKPPLTEAEIRKLLESGIPMASSSDATGPVSDLSWYYALVKATLYEAWTPPSGLSVGAGVSTQVRIHVLRDGTITEREMVQGSGNSGMDASVMKAVRSVARLKALPGEVPGDYKDITVSFEPTPAF